MMNEKKLLYFDRSKFQTLQRQIEKAVDETNNLINNFEALQTFVKIRSREQAAKLLADPIGTFDNAILSNIGLQNAAGLNADPSAVAALFNIDRPAFLRELGGYCPRPGSCRTFPPESSNGHDKKVEFRELSNFGDYMAFGDNCRFQVDESAVEGAKERFRVYATTPEQLRELNRWEGLCNELNRHIEKGHISRTVVRELAGKMKFLSDGETFSLDYYTLSMLLLRNDYEKHLKN